MRLWLTEGQAHVGESFHLWDLKIYYSVESEKAGARWVDCMHCIMHGPS